MHSHWLSAIVFTLITLFPNCRKYIPAQVTAEQFGQWFMGTSLQPPREFASLTDSTIDSFCHAFRRLDQSERGSVVMVDTTGKSYTIGFRTPEVFREDSTYPCIIYLHGGTGTNATDKGVQAYAMLDMLADSMSLFLVSPSANREAPWWGATGLSRILQALRYMSLHFPINPDKVFLVGVSDGATGCYAAANTIAAPFAGFIAISGFGGMLPQLGMELYPQNCMQRPIYSVSAGKDHLYPIKMVMMFLDQLENQGVNLRRKVYDEEAHGFAYRDREAGTLCSIIREWSRPVSDAMNWKFGTKYPIMIDHVLAMERENGTITGTIEAGCINDTFLIKSSGLEKIQMYFEEGSKCAACRFVKVNNRNYRIKAPKVGNKDMYLLLMKQRCFPELKKMNFYTFTF